MLEFRRRRPTDVWRRLRVLEERTVELIDDVEKSLPQRWWLPRYRKRDRILRGGWVNLLIPSSNAVLVAAALTESVFSARGFSSASSRRVCAKRRGEGEALNLERGVMMKHVATDVTAVFCPAAGTADGVVDRLDVYCSHFERVT